MNAIIIVDIDYCTDSDWQAHAIIDLHWLVVVTVIVIDPVTV